MNKKPDRSMTDGEKMVWAAVFAKEYNIHNAPKSVLIPGKEEAWEEWELDQLGRAVELAAGAVLRLREAEQRILDGWDGHDIANMYLEIIGEKRDG